MMITATTHTNRHRDATNECFVSPSFTDGRKMHYHHQPFSKMFGKWIGAVGHMDVRADLTFRQVIFLDKNDSYLPSHQRKKEWIDDKLAKDNLRHFLHRLNYDCYKSAYKRFGKKIRVVPAIEGGRSMLRDARGGKRLHIHLLLERPSHIDYMEFRDAIIKNWKSTKWGYNQNLIEEIKSLYGSAKYQVKTSLDAIDLENIHLG